MLPAPAAADERNALIGSLAPNVLVLLDISGSMADSVPSSLYVPTRRYPVQQRCASMAKKGKSSAVQACATNAVFKGPAYARYADSVSALTGNGSEAARTALAQSGHWSGTIHGVHVALYQGNYVNYLLAGCASGGACPESKMTAAKRAIGAVLDTVRGVRFGIMTFQYGPHGVRGGRMVAPLGSSAQAIRSALSTLGPARDAPLGDALHDVGRYFKGEALTDGASFPSPIQLGCQSNHVIIVADGGQTAGARSLTAEATLRKEQDHAPSLPDVQRVVVHTIGFGVTVNTAAPSADRALADLRQAADNGAGTFAQAAIATELETSLRQALARLTEGTYSLTHPVLAGTAAGSRRAYVASFHVTASRRFWRGLLKAYQRDASGLVPVDEHGVPLASALVWNAAQALNALSPASRTIYTELGGRLTPFTKSNTAITRVMLGASSAADRDRVIDFVRGVDVNDENGVRGTGDERPWKLGAIVHSTPVLVTAPVLALSDASYQTFKAAQARRTKVLIAAAHDGMLHAFREKDGVEIWAFIPPDTLDRLRALSAVDAAPAVFVDGSPIAADIKIAGTWKTIVVVGGRRGGPSYYALDITDTANPKFLWRFTDARIREARSEPAIGRMKLGGAERHVAFIGSGHGKSVLALDLATGTRLWEYAGTAGATDDRQHMRFSVMATPTAVDTDNDGHVDHVYVGDLGGQLWKFDVSAGDANAWTGKRLFFAKPSLAEETTPGGGIHAAPAVALDHLRNVWVFFGTAAPDDANSTWAGRFYGLKDDTDMTNGAALTEASPGIKDVTTATVSAPKGWYVVLAARAETPLGPATVFNGTLLFTTFTPDRAGVCGPGGGSTKLYALQMASGYARMDFVTGAPLAAPTAASPRFKEIGRGIGSMPVVVLKPPGASDPAATASVVVGLSSQALASTAIPAPPFLKHVRSWRER